MDWIQVNGNMKQNEETNINESIPKNTRIYVVWQYFLHSLTKMIKKLFTKMKILS